MIRENEKEQFVQLASKYDPSVLHAPHHGAADKLISDAKSIGIIDQMEKT